MQRHASTDVQDRAPGGMAAESRPKPWGRRRSDHEPNRGWRPALLVILTVAGLDWITKAVVAASVPVGGFIELWSGRVAFWHVKNPEMALGLWGNLPLGWRQAIAALAGIAAVFLFFEIVARGHRLPPQRRIWAWLFAGLAFGGILGNLGERALHWNVTDFLSLSWAGVWLPPGNLADLALISSIPLAIVVIAFELQARAQRAPSRAARAAAALGTPETSASG